MEDTKTPGPMRRGASIIFIDPSCEVLLCLRDDKAGIPFPNCWDLFGGGVEPDETPQECIVREMKEELDLTIAEPRLYKITHFDDRIEYTFFQTASRDLVDRPQYEGKGKKWFSKAEIQSLPLEAIAFGFREILLEFFARRAWLSRSPT